MTSAPARWSIVPGMPIPTASTESVRSSSTRPAICFKSASASLVTVGTSRSASRLPPAAMRPASTFVPPTSTPITVPVTGAA